MELDKRNHFLALIENHGLSVSRSLYIAPSKSTYFYELINKASKGISKDEI